MLTSFMDFMAAAVAPSAAMSAAICDVGRVALRDLPTTNHNPGHDTYYAGADRYHRDLLEVCPELQSEPPTGYALADDAARSRANLPAPIPGHVTKPAFIYAIGVPEISADLKTATVHFDLSCTGLCGGRSEGRYVRTPGGWRRQGAIRTLVVS